MRRIVSLFSALILGLTLTALAQEFRATISGDVVDASGAPVEGAKVVVTNIEKNTATETTTNSSGRYAAQFLPPGKYQLTIEKAGFKKFVRGEIVLSAADRLAIDVKLEVGALTESTQVTAATPLLQTETASRTATIENRVLENIPTSGRNLYQLQYTLPGVTKNSTYWGSMELYAFGNVNNVSISGGRSGENETLIDGVANTHADRGVTLVPSLNSTQEFTIHTNTYDAQFGRVGGGVTSITIKSGTNALHGQLFEFFKNEKLNANDWIANKNNEERTKYRNNTFGFEVDGPVYIPKLFDGRNRAFFMISLEGLRERQEQSLVTSLPTAEMLRGDFSKLTNNSGRLITIHDPLTTRLNPNYDSSKPQTADNPRYIRTPFQNNIIPANRINPIAAKAASFYPKPNRPSDNLDNLGNYAVFNPTRNGYDAWLGKMDFHLAQDHQVSFRYGQTPWSNFARIAWGTNAAEPSGESPSTRVSRNWGADWTYIISPSLVFNLRGGLARYEAFSGNSFGGGFDPKELGFPASLVSQFTALQFPRFEVGTANQPYSPLGATQVSGYETHDTWSLQPNLSWNQGHHFRKMGVEFRLYNQNRHQPGAASGQYSFNKTASQNNPAQGDAFSGNEFASFLLGYPTGGTVPRNIDPAYQNKYFALFLQDDWKVTPNLTLNLGLRWDLETPRVERYDRMVRGFAFDQPSPIAGRVSGLNLRGGLLFANENNREAFLRDKNNFQPRIGVAYQFRDKWVLRAGYGLTYLGQHAAGSAGGFSRPTPLIATTDGGLTPAVSLSDPFPTSLYPNGLLKPVGNSLGLATDLGQPVTAQFLDRPLPYSQQFSVGIQRELPGGWLVDASYVGNITRKLPVSLNQNFIPLDILNSIPVADRAAYFNARVPNPMAGQLPNSGFNGSDIPRQQLLFAFPQYSQVTITDVPVGSQRYDSLQTKVTRRFSKGLAASVAYTISKTLEQVAPLNAQDVNLNDLPDTKLEKRLYQFDVPQKLAVVMSYELPFGKGKRFGDDFHPILNGVAGNWNLNMQYVHQSGFPFDHPNAAPLQARSAKLSNDQRDERAKANGRFDPSVDKWFDTSLFPTAAQAPFTLRNFPTRFPDVRSPALRTWEISVFKDFVIKERVRWQIRGDFQNAFNFPFFGALQTNNVTDSRFGQLRADITNQQRQVALVMKVLF